MWRLHYNETYLWSRETMGALKTFKKIYIYILVCGLFYNQIYNFIIYFLFYTTKPSFFFKVFLLLITSFPPGHNHSIHPAENKCSTVTFPTGNCCRVTSHDKEDKLVCQKTNIQLEDVCCLETDSEHPEVNKFITYKRKHVCRLAIEWLQVQYVCLTTAWTCCNMNLAVSVCKVYYNHL